MSKQLKCIETPRLIRWKNIILPKNTFFGNRVWWWFYDKNFIYKTEFGFKIIINLGQSLERNIFFNGKVYCKREFEIIKSYYTGSGVFLDVGANIGYVSMWVARNFSAANVFSVEGDPNTFEILSENVAINGLANIKLVNCLLGVDNAEVKFYRNFKNNVGANSLLKRSSQAETISLKSRSLKSVLDSEGINQIEFMKIDVEGAEYDVMKSFFGNVKLQMYPKCILFEDLESPVPDSVVKLKILLRSVGYVIKFEGDNSLAVLDI